MAVITERPREKRLGKYKVNIRTEFFDSGKKKVRNTDGSQNDDIDNGIILTKSYYSGGTLLYKETDFSPALHYSYVRGTDPGKKYVCPNCGASGKGEEFSYGCPYCGTYYNTDYIRKQLAGQYHGNYLTNNKKKLAAAAAVISLLCIGAAVLFCRVSGRTFTVFDVLKGVLIGLIASVFLFLVFLAASYIRTSAEERRKYERQERLLTDFKAELAKIGMTFSQFFNNLNSELASYFFDENGENKNVIDYDALEYDDFFAETDANGRWSCRLTMTARLISFENGRIASKRKILHLTLQKTEEEHSELHGGVNIIKCRGCGASVNAEKGCCEYCGTKIKFMQKLYLTKTE